MLLPRVDCPRPERVEDDQVAIQAGEQAALPVPEPEDVRRVLAEDPHQGRQADSVGMHGRVRDEGQHLLDTRDAERDVKEVAVGLLPRPCLAGGVAADHVDLAVPQRIP